MGLKAGTRILSVQQFQSGPNSRIRQLEDFLLMPVDPAGEDQEQQLPRLQDRLHISPDAV